MQAAPHLDDGIVSEILHRLPTKEAYRLAAVCRRWRAVLCQPTFLCRHLSPRPLPLLDDGPSAFIVQPRGKTGYSHLTLVATNPGDGFPVRFPVPGRYMDRLPPQRQIVRVPRPDPTPALLDKGAEKSVFRLLYSTGADDEDDVPYVSESESESEDVAAEAEQPVVGSLFDGSDSEDDAAEQQAAVVVPTATVIDVAEPDTVRLEHPDQSPPASQVQVEDYVVFFEKTVPMLDISIVASHGRLLLARSQSRFYVCDPGANRWLALPPSTIAPDSDANRGLEYHVDASTGNTIFTVVLLLRRRLRRGLVEAFSSTTGTWNVRELRSEGVTRCLGAASPGVHVGTCFYWLSRRKGRIVRYDAARGRASVLREPPEAEQSRCRVGRALGTAGARLRLCAFDIRDERGDSMLPHDGLEGVHGVWVMMEGVPSSWRRVHEALVEDISVWYFLSLHNHETPVDFAGASDEFIVVDKGKRLLRYDLDSGHKVPLFSLYRDAGRLGALYRRYHAFAFFR
ncbi:hypothetical protein CFC21_010389 [Triticum aestivum]|uniref:F-box domain-containing protein n=2 Tax=Triticum aestivum TaxID=4565 RepID=A0A9R1DKH2_WHEAT|nr:hypothetical protein CFC21_010389 [Triticum aestivum]